MHVSRWLDEGKGGDGYRGDVNVPRDFSPPVQNFDGRRISHLLLALAPHLRYILPLDQHAERRAKRQIPNDVEREIIEPVERVHGVPRVPSLGFLRAPIPLSLQLLEIGVHVHLKLANRLRREGMRHGFAFARVFSPVARVEQAAADGHEGVVVVALQEAVAVPVHHRDGARIRDADMVRRDAHQLPVLLVRRVHGEVSSTAPRLVEQP